MIQNSNENANNLTYFQKYFVSNLEKVVSAANGDEGDMAEASGIDMDTSYVIFLKSMFSFKT